MIDSCTIPVTVTAATTPDENDLMTEPEDMTTEPEDMTTDPEEMSTDPDADT